MSSCSDDEDTNVFVLDTGSKNWRVGFAGDDCPTFIVPSTAKPLDINLDINIHSMAANDLAWSPDSICYSHRDDHMNEDHFVSLMEFTLQRLVEKHMKYVKSSEDAVILNTEPILPSRRVRNRILEIMMEQFSVAGYSVSPSPILSLYTSGRGSGVVLESGHHFTQTVVIYEGYLPDGTANRVDFGGHDLTKFLQENTHPAPHDTSYGLYDQAKRNLLFTDNNEIKLPDGKAITWDNAEVMKQCGDFMLSDCLPPSNTSPPTSIASLVYDTVMRCDVYTRADIFTNIILSGGNTMYRNFNTLLKDKFITKFSSKHPNGRANVVAMPERLYAPWIGGSILGSLSVFTNGAYRIDKQIYEEEGTERALDRRCNYIKYASIDDKK